MRSTLCALNIPQHSDNMWQLINTQRACLNLSSQTSDIAKWWEGPAERCENPTQTNSQEQWTCKTCYNNKAFLKNLLSPNRSKELHRFSLIVQSARGWFYQHSKHSLALKKSALRSLSAKVEGQVPLGQLPHTTIAWFQLISCMSLTICEL